MLSSFRGFVVCFALLFFPEHAARGEEVAPSTAVSPHLKSARRTAEDELHALLLSLPAPTQQRLRGTYVAFDGASLDVNALAACDDDGDHVVVLTDSLLRTLGFVARAAATDATLHSHKLLEYGTLLGVSQRAGQSFLPPAPGFFDLEGNAGGPDLESDVFREALSGIVAHELAHILDGDVACSAPTATREQGDDVWTAAEQALALAHARLVYTAASVLEADRSAARVFRHGGPAEAGPDQRDDGYLDWLTFADAIDRARPPTSVPLYLALHPQPGARRRSVSASR